MDRKARLGLAAGVLVAFMAVTAAGAQAATVPRWFVSWKQATTSKPINGVGPRKDSTITFGLPAPGGTVTCRVSIAGTIVDLPEAAGIGEVTGLAFSKCSPSTAGCGSAALEILPTGLPWQSQLVIAGPAIRDVIEGAQLDFRCGGGSGLGTFTGTLSPVVNDRESETKAPHCHPTAPKPCAQLEFDHEQLSGAAGVLELNGVEHVGSGGRPIEVKSLTY